MHSLTFMRCPLSSLQDSSFSRTFLGTHLLLLFKTVQNITTEQHLRICKLIQKIFFKQSKSISTTDFYRLCASSDCVLLQSDHLADLALCLSFYVMIPSSELFSERLKCTNTQHSHITLLLHNNFSIDIFQRIIPFLSAKYNM